MFPAQFVGLAHRFRLLCCIFPDSFQHPEACLAFRSIYLAEQALVYQRVNYVQHVSILTGLRSLVSDRCLVQSLSQIECETAHAGRHTPEQPSFILVQQVIAPCHRVAHGLLPVWQVLRATCQEPKGLFEPLKERLGR